MKKTMLMLCLCSAIALAQTAPTDPSVSLQNGDHLDKLYLASTSGVKSSGAAKVIFSYGIASAEVVYVYRDATALVKTTEVRPVFHIIGNMSTAPRDIVIIRLQQKKDHRELQTAKVNAYSGMKMQYPPQDTIEVDVQDSANERIITPKVDLKPGEYMLFVGSPTPMPTGSGGYDFSVVPVK
jgi:hypothetical protein